MKFDGMLLQTWCVNLKLNFTYAITYAVACTMQVNDVKLISSPVLNAAGDSELWEHSRETI